MVLYCFAARTLRHLILPHPCCSLEPVTQVLLKGVPQTCKHQLVMNVPARLANIPRTTCPTWVFMLPCSQCDQSPVPTMDRHCPVKNRGWPADSSRTLDRVSPFFFARCVAGRPTQRCPNTAGQQRAFRSRQASCHKQRLPRVLSAKQKHIKRWAHMLGNWAALDQGDYSNSGLEVSRGCLVPGGLARGGCHYGRQRCY